MADENTKLNYDQANKELNQLILRGGSSNADEVKKFLESLDSEVAEKLRKDLKNLKTKTNKDANYLKAILRDNNKETLKNKTENKQKSEVEKIDMSRGETMKDQKNKNGEKKLEDQKEKKSTKKSKGLIKKIIAGVGIVLIIGGTGAGIFAACKPKKTELTDAEVKKCNTYFNNVKEKISKETKGKVEISSINDVEFEKNKQNALLNDMVLYTSGNETIVASKSTKLSELLSNYKENQNSNTEGTKETETKTSQFKVSFTGVTEANKKKLQELITQASNQESKMLDTLKLLNSIVQRGSKFGGYEEIKSNVSTLNMNDPNLDYRILSEVQAQFEANGQSQKAQEVGSIINELETKFDNDETIENTNTMANYSTKQLKDGSSAIDVTFATTYKDQKCYTLSYELTDITTLVGEDAYRDLFEKLLTSDSVSNEFKGYSEEDMTMPRFNAKLTAVLQRAQEILEAEKEQAKKSEENVPVENNEMTV